MAIKQIWKLIQAIESGKCWLCKELPTASGYSYLELHYGDVKFKSNNGWEIVVFFDCGEWDYFDSFVSPQGEKLCFDDFPSDIRCYRPDDDIAKIMYGEPGYLGCWLESDEQV